MPPYSLTRSPPAFTVPVCETDKTSMVFIFLARSLPVAASHGALSSQGRLGQAVPETAAACLSVCRVSLWGQGVQPRCYAQDTDLLSPYAFSSPRSPPCLLPGCRHCAGSWSTFLCVEFCKYEGLTYKEAM